MAAVLLFAMPSHACVLEKGPDALVTIDCQGGEATGLYRRLAELEGVNTVIILIQGEGHDKDRERTLVESHPDSRRADGHQVRISGKTILAMPLAYTPQ